MLLNSDLSIEGFFAEARLRKKTWLLCLSYNPKKNLIANLMRNFKVKPNDATMKNFCQIYSCKNIIKDRTCFKNPINPTCIDLTVTNRPKSFQEPEVIKTGLSDFYNSNGHEVVL